MSQSEPDAELLIEHVGPVSWIVLNRPAQANALSSALLESFSAAFQRLEREGGPIIGIRANGKGFCSGMDLGQYGGAAAMDPTADAQRLNANVARWLSIWDHPKPVIAAVHDIAAQLCVFSSTTLAEF